MTCRALPEERGLSVVVVVFRNRSLCEGRGRKTNKDAKKRRRSLLDWRCRAPVRKFVGLSPPVFASVTHPIRAPRRRNVSCHCAL